MNFFQSITKIVSDAGEAIGSAASQAGQVVMEAATGAGEVIGSAARLMVDKALLAGGTGFASSLVPGSAVALLAADFTATMLLQAEMVYQIACAYGLDLQEPARKGEILAIFGLSLGSSQILNMGVSYAAKAGLSVLQNVPVAGAVIGASTNAVMLYSLGYGACRFYEAKLDMVPLLPNA